MIVADTNVIAYLVIDGAHTATADLARARDATWCVPHWWRSEFLNVLVMATRHGAVKPEDAASLWKEALALMRGTEVEVDEQLVLRTAIDHGLTAYDAWFVALADALDVRLVTADRRLVAARPDRAVLLEDFAR